MGLFSKKTKKSPEELKKERDAKITSTSNKLKQQLLLLEKKKSTALAKIVEAKNKGLKEQEAMARNHLKQVLASIKRESGMLMSLELAVEARDLAELNTNFMESIGNLSDEIISSSKSTSKSKTKKIGNKFIEASFHANQQKERIDEMLEIGEYANAIGQGSNEYTEYDDEIDSLVNDAEMSMSFNSTPNRTRI